MELQSLGISTSDVEVTNISQHGIWILVDDEEPFLPFDEFPWFKDAPVQSPLNVERQGAEHLHWSDLDVNLTLDSIGHLKKCPLVSKKSAAQVT